MPIRLTPIKEQVIVITGASSGIGLATALEAGRRGAQVVLASRDETDILKGAGQITAEGGKALGVVADVADQGRWSRAPGLLDSWQHRDAIPSLRRADPSTRCARPG
jgi:NAD(P)-dependent dehydrogenase (short-subunit alcohol dehydrogenase family)